MPGEAGEKKAPTGPFPQDALVYYQVFGRREQPVTAEEAFGEIDRALDAMTDVPAEEIAAAKEAFQRLAGDAETFKLTPVTRRENPEFFFELDEDGPGKLMQYGSPPLEASDREIFQQAQTVCGLVYEGAAWPGHQHLELMKRLADVVAQLSEGIVTDFVAHAINGQMIWRAIMAEQSPQAVHHIVWHTVSDDERRSGERGVWIHTHGMGKFALPDLELRRVPQNFQENGASLLVEAAQWLIDNGNVPFATIHPFGYHNTEWMFMPVLDEEEHRDGPVLSLVVPHDNPFEPEKMGEGLFAYGGGVANDEMGPPLEEDDAEIQAAYEQAMETLPAFKQRFEAAAAGHGTDDEELC